MSDEERSFVQKMEDAFHNNERTYKKWKKFFIWIISILTASVMTLGYFTITGTAANTTAITYLRSELNAVKLAAELQKALDKKDYADIFMVNNLIRSFKVQTDIMLNADDKNLNHKQIIDLFNGWRMEAMQINDDYIQRGETIK